MNTIDLEKDYKDRVLDVWHRYENIDILNEKGCEYRKSPLLPKTVKKNAILFMGINPAFSERRKDEIRNLAIEFYPIISDEVKDIDYFDKFKKISQYCNNAEWTHLDLFFLRETNQEVIDKLSYTNVDFLQAQLQITFEIINTITPKIIVVSNSLASEFFGKRKEKKHSKLDKIWMGYNLDFEKDFNGEIGTYKIKIGEKETPIIFCGMLPDKEH